MPSADRSRVSASSWVLPGSVSVVGGASCETLSVVGGVSCEALSVVGGVSYETLSASVEGCCLSSSFRLGRLEGKGPSPSAHNGSQVPYDVFTNYSLKDECEDFAETFRFFGSDTESNLKVAIRNAGDGHSKELDKMLFMASLFITGDPSTPDYDGTITFYKPDPADSTYSDPYKVPYTKTKDAFQMDGYTFALSGSTITGITDASGARASQLLTALPSLTAAVEDQTLLLCLNYEQLSADRSEGLR